MPSKPFCITNPSNVSDMSIQAYAKLVSEQWTYYLQDLEIVIGRSSESTDATHKEDYIDLDLGKSKIISRKHAKIRYNFEMGNWEIFVLGRNGLKVNSVHFKPSQCSIEIKDR